MGTPATLVELAQGIGGEYEAAPASGREADGAVAGVKIRGDRWSEKRLGVIAQQFDAWCGHSGGRVDVAAIFPADPDARGYGPPSGRACWYTQGDEAAMISQSSVEGGFRWYHYSFYDAVGLKLYLSTVQEAARRHTINAREAADKDAARKLVDATRKTLRDRQFQASLKPGDLSDQGLIIEVKSPLALVQKCQTLISRLGLAPECINATTMWVPITALGAAES